MHDMANMKKCHTSKSFAILQILCHMVRFIKKLLDGSPL